MKPTFFLPSIAVLAILSVFESFAQPAPFNATNAVEELPPSSPYGEARLTRNIPYVVNPTPRQNFNLYIPKTTNGQPLPLVFWIHGGAWMMGEKEWDNVKYLVRHGYAIASVDYRISPEAGFPAQIQDCNAALNYVLAHAAEYGINPRQLVIGGGSAGGNLALLLGLARHEKLFGADPSIKPMAILDFFGPADLTRMLDDLESIHSDKGVQLIQDASAKLLGPPGAEASAKAKIASPINYVGPSSAPVLILQGSKDDLVPPVQSQRLHDALDQAKVKNQIIMVEIAGHDGPLFSTPEIESKVVSFLNGVFADPTARN